MVGRVFLITVCGERTDKFALSAPYIQSRADFDGDVAAVFVVYYIFERNNNVVYRLRIFKAVNTVVNRNKPYIKKRENCFKIFTRFNVISAESLKVFDNYAVKPFFGYV